jgi:phage-related protein
VTRRFQAFADGESGPGFQRLLDFFITQGPPAIRSIADLFGGLATVVGHIGEAFAPLAQTLLGSLATGAQQLGATLGGPDSPLTSFIDRVTTILPTVLGVLSAVSGLALEVFKAVQPLAGPFLAAIGNLASFISQAFATPAFQNFLAGIMQAIPLLLPGLKSLVDNFALLLGAVGPVLPIIAGLASTLVQALAPVFVVLVKALAPLIPILAQVIASLGTGLAQVLAVLIPPLGRLILALVQGLAPIIPVVVKVVEALATALAPVIDALTVALAPVIPIIVDAFNQLLTALLPLLPVITNLAVQIIQQLAPQLPSLITSALALSTAFVQILIALTPLLPILVSVAGFLINVAGALVQVIAWVAALVATIETFYAAVVVKIIGVIVGLPGIFSTVFSQVKGFVTDAFGSIVDTITSLPGKITGLGGKLLDAGASLIGDLFQGMKNAASGVAGFAEDIGRAILDGINELLHLPIKIPEINTHIPGVGTVGGQTLLPRFANGGIIDAATLALIGEAGREAVLPLTNPRRSAQIAEESGLLDVLRRGGLDVRGGTGGDGSGVTLHTGDIYGADPNEIADRLYQDVQDGLTLEGV